MPLFFNLSLISLVFKLSFRTEIHIANQRKRIKNSKVKRIIPSQLPIHLNKLPNNLFLLFKRKKLSPMLSLPPSQITD